MSEALRKKLAELKQLQHYDGKDADGIKFAHVDTVSILAPGPSLLDHDIPEGPLRIGVNGAVEAVRCDVWACYDKICLMDFTPIGTPSRIHALPPMSKDYQLIRQKFRGFGSVGLAISVSWHLGAKVINVYGADWIGDEHVIPNKRLIAKGFLNPPGRWENEAELFGLLQKELLKTWMGRHATELNRIVLDVFPSGLGASANGHPAGVAGAVEVRNE